MALHAGISLALLVTMATVVALSVPSVPQVALGMEGCTDNKGVVCNRHGLCRGEECQCAMAYYGTFCQHSMAGKCGETKDCIRCSTFHSGPLSKGRQCQYQCLHSDDSVIAGIRVVKRLEDDIQCSFVDDDGCVFRYGLVGSDSVKDKLLVHVHRDKECPPF